MKFAYTKYFFEPTKAHPHLNYFEYPTLSVTLQNLNTKQDFENYIVVVDSGASNCVFHSRIGRAMGIDITSVLPVPMRGVGYGVGKQYFHPIRLMIGGNKVDLEAAFTDDLNIPFGLLGQKGFFEKFRVCFDLPKRNFEIVPKIIRKS